VAGGLARSTAALASRQLVEQPSDALLAVVSEEMLAELAGAGARSAVA
jgi:hypothetical protein